MSERVSRLDISRPERFTRREVKKGVAPSLLGVSDLRGLPNGPDRHRAERATRDLLLEDLRQVEAIID